jgi:hypothetical protein
MHQDLIESRVNPLASASFKSDRLQAHSEEHTGFVPSTELYQPRFHSVEAGPILYSSRIVEPVARTRQPADFRIKKKGELLKMKDAVMQRKGEDR